MDVIAVDMLPLKLLFWTDFGRIDRRRRLLWAGGWGGGEQRLCRHHQRQGS